MRAFVPMACTTRDSRHAYRQSSYPAFVLMDGIDGLLAESLASLLLGLALPEEHLIAGSLSVRRIGQQPPDNNACAGRRLRNICLRSSFQCRPKAIRSPSAAEAPKARYLQAREH